MMSLRRSTIFLLIAFVLMGCAQPPKVELQWRAEPNFDPFADVETCRVTTWYAQGDAPGTRPASYLYPVVEKRGAAVMVGVMTAPMHIKDKLIAAPTGDVQIKVDDNPTWTIAAIETPADVLAGTSSQVRAQKLREKIEATMKANPPATGQITSTTASSVTDAIVSAHAAMSPKTLATGEKAQQIIAQMQRGSGLMFRRLGTSGAAASEPISVPLTGFGDAMAQCGL